MPEAAAPHAADEAQLVDALRRRDEAAFAELIDRHHASLVRLAMIYVRNRAVAEEVAQETWLGVLRGIDRFEERSSLKTWIFRILTNTAKTRAVREGRTLPFSSIGDDLSLGEASVVPERFLGVDHPRWPGHWSSPPSSWEGIPEDRLLGRETLELVERAIAELPPAQQQVITLRDVQGWSSEEVRSLLDISEVNQRVLLHRARSRVRRALEGYLAA
jgi:RNA polymerase sigma-70 factor, ECF subfamily